MIVAPAKQNSFERVGKPDSFSKEVRQLYARLAVYREENPKFFAWFENVFSRTLDIDHMLGRVLENLRQNAGDAAETYRVGPIAGRLTSDKVEDLSGLTARISHLYSERAGNLQTIYMILDNLEKTDSPMGDGNKF